MGEPGLGDEAAGGAQDAAGFGVADREGHSFYCSGAGGRNSSRNAKGPEMQGTKAVKRKRGRLVWLVLNASGRINSLLARSTSGEGKTRR
jgi:hypothetical protein